MCIITDVTSKRRETYVSIHTIKYRKGKRDEIGNAAKQKSILATKLYRCNYHWEVEYNMYMYVYACVSVCV